MEDCGYAQSWGTTAYSDIGAPWDGSGYETVGNLSSLSLCAAARGARALGAGTVAGWVAGLRVCRGEDGGQGSRCS